MADPPPLSADPSLKLTKREEYTLGFYDHRVHGLFGDRDDLRILESNSMALLSDAVAMMVDACHYMFNGCAIAGHGSWASRRASQR